jgi:hypothetical protein
MQETMSEDEAQTTQHTIQIWDGTRGKTRGHNQNVKLGFSIAIQSTITTDPLRSPPSLI